MSIATQSPAFGTLSEGPLIARGAFGVVRLCHSSTIGLCAVKTIPLPHEDAWVSAQREARALQLAAGEHTVRFLGMLRLEPSSTRPIPMALLVMEYVSGGTLASLASQWRPTSGRGLPTGLLKRYTRSIVAAVAYVHAQGMAHRDIKGANLILSPETQGVKLADFGSCKLPAGATEDLDGGTSPGFSAAPGGSALPSDSFPHAAAASAAGPRPTTAVISAKGVHHAAPGPAPGSPRGEVGTISWMAPEVVKRGAGDHAHAAAGSSRSPAAAAQASTSSLAFWQAADVWGLGCTVLELLTGRPPWHGVAEEASEIMLCIASSDLRDRLPAWAGEEVLDFLRACLHPDPSQRPPAAELLYSPFLYGGDFEDVEAAVGLEAAPPSSSLAGGEVQAQPRSRASSRAAAAAQVAFKPHPQLRAAAQRAARPPPAPLGALLHSLGSLPPTAMASALASCDSLKSEVRLSCRQVQHWFLGLHGASSSAYGSGSGSGSGSAGKGGAAAGSHSPSTDWVMQCLFTEDRVSLGEHLEGFSAAAGGYGPLAVALVTQACTAAPCPPVMHRECAASIVFGGAAESAWTCRVEASLLLGALASAVLAAVAAGSSSSSSSSSASKGRVEGVDSGVLAFLIHLLDARLGSWEHAGVPLDSSRIPLDGALAVAAEEEEEGAGLGGGSATTLGTIAVAMQWLATARVRLSVRSQAAEEARREGEGEEEEEEEEGVWESQATGRGAAAAAAAEEEHAPIGITVPDFAVLFYTRIAVWVAELGTTLRALQACSAAWEGVMGSAGPQEAAAFDIPALAVSHQQLARKAYSRLLAVRRCWEFGKGAVGFGVSSPRKSPPA